MKLTSKVLENKLKPEHRKLPILVGMIVSILTVLFTFLGFAIQWRSSVKDAQIEELKKENAELQHSKRDNLTTEETRKLRAIREQRRHEQQTATNLRNQIDEDQITLEKLQWDKLVTKSELDDTKAQDEIEKTQLSATRKLSQQTDSDYAAKKLELDNIKKKIGEAQATLASQQDALRGPDKERSTGTKNVP